MIVHKFRKVIIGFTLVVFLISAGVLPIFASPALTDDNLGLFSLQAYIGTFDSSTPTWSNVSYTFTSSDGYLNISIPNVGSTGHAYRVALRFMYYDGGYKSFTLNNYSADFTIGRTVSSSGSWSVTSDYLSSYADGYDPMFVFTYVRPTSSTIDGISRVGSLGLNYSRHLSYSFDSPVQVTNGLYFQWEGFNAFGDVTLNIRLKLVINDTAIDEEHILKEIDDLTEEKQEVVATLLSDLVVPTPNTTDLFSGMDDVVQAVNSQQFSTVISSMWQNGIIPLFMLLSVSFSVLGYILFGKSG